MQIRFIKLVTTAILLGCGIAVFSQTAAKPAYLENEIGIDVANIITFLSKKNESYLINYKRHLTEKHAFRSGLNLDLSTAKDGYKTFKMKMGYEYDYPILDRWQLYCGADVSLRYQANNFQPNTSVRYGLSPLIGFSFFLGKRFSISTELSINCLYTDYSNPASFDPDANVDVWEVNVGSVGMLVVSYHF